MFVESLKRLRINRFEHGVIEGTGPEFNVKSAMGDKQKLAALLNDFVNRQGLQSVTTWKIVLVKGQGSAEGAAAQTPTTDRSNVEAVQDHPALQSLQKVFPGSKVEQVRAKNN